MRTYKEKIDIYNEFLEIGLKRHGHGNLLYEPFNKVLGMSGDVRPLEADFRHSKEYPYVKVMLNPTDYYDIIEIWSELNEVREYFRSQD